MKSYSRSQLFLLYSLSGIFLGVGFIFPWLWFCGLFGVGIFLLAIKNTTNKWEVVLGGFIAWTIKSLFAISWFWSTYPIEWIDLSLGAAEAPVVGFYWLTVSCFIGLGGILTSLGWWFLKKYVGGLWGLIVFPVIWLLSELMGSLMFSIFTIGEGIKVSTIFSFGYLGYLLSNHALLILLAKFGGVYILSFLVAILGYLGILIYETFPKTKSSIFITVTILVIIATGFEYLPKENVSPKLGEIKVAIIDTKFGGQVTKRGDFESYKNEQLKVAVKTAMDLNSDYIVLPEDSRFTNSNLPSQMAYRYFRFESSDSRVVLIDSGKYSLPNGGSVLRAIVYDGVSKNGWSVDKQYQVPQGEFMPYFYQGILSALGMKKTVIEIQKSLNYRPGPFFSQAQLPETVPAILFCFESADPYAIRRLLKERKVPFVAHLVSHAWFHESRILWYQLDSMIKIQAIWNQTAIVSAGNMTRGALYTKEGGIYYPENKAEGEYWRVGIIKL